MKRNEFKHLCSEADAGRDAFVRHSASNEEGLVTGCVLKSNHMVVKTAGGDTRCWDFNECEELSHRKTGPMI